MKKKFNVLVTGATGLVGGYTVEELLNSGYKVFTLQRKIRPDSYLYKSGLYKRCKNLFFNILDLNALEKLIKKEKIDYIIHLAAQLKVVSLYETFSFNILGTLNMLEAVKNNKQIKGLVLSSSNRAYGQKTLSRKEIKQLLKSPYDLSKTMAEQLSESYLQNFDLPVVTARFGNIYGAGDGQKRIISKIITHILNGETLELDLSSARRSYIFGQDVARGLVLILKNFSKLKHKSVGFETKDIFSVKELIQKISQIVGKQCKLKIKGEMKEDIAYKKIDSKLARKILGWRPRESFKSGIIHTYEWYLDKKAK